MKHKIRIAINISQHIYRKSSILWHITNFLQVTHARSRVFKDKVVVAPIPGMELSAYLSGLPSVYSGFSLMSI